jgi:hypothetical protein
MKKIFCNFICEQDINKTCLLLMNEYPILNKQIFIFKTPTIDDLIITYNIADEHNMVHHLLPNTIFLHRKKQSNTLYTLNALNKLIKSTIPDYDEILSNNKVEWENHRNTLLIIRDNELKTLPIKITKIYK